MKPRIEENQSMNKTTEKKLSKQISQGFLFRNGMLPTSDEIYERCRGYSCNINLNLKTNWNKITY
jgi:hypothetical protein